MEYDHNYPDDDEQPQGEDLPPDDGAHEPTSRFAEAISNAVNYHVTEYDLTAASIVGVLAMEAIRRALHAMGFEIPSEQDDEDQGD